MCWQCTLPALLSCNHLPVVAALSLPTEIARDSQHTYYLHLQSMPRPDEMMSVCNLPERYWRYLQSDYCAYSTSVQTVLLSVLHV
jgi:hypothetical protein